MASIDEFIRTGRLGDISFGMGRPSVRALLGEPEATSRQKDSEIWKYGALQLGFHCGPLDDEPLLTTINLYFHDPTDSFPEGIGLDGWRPNEESTVETFRDYIGREDSDVGEVIPQVDDAIVTLAPGVQATFDNGRLYGLHARSKRGEGKQLTLFVPNDMLEVLRKAASERGISVQSLCVRWIAERAERRQEMGVG